MAAQGRWSVALVWDETVIDSTNTTSIKELGEWLYCLTSNDVHVAIRDLVTGEQHVYGIVG